MMLFNTIKDLASIREKDWLFEPKKDGLRAYLSYIKGKAKLLNRDMKDITANYPEIAKLWLGRYDFVVDGELCCSDFESLMSRQHTTDIFKINMLSKRQPCTFYAFDIVAFNRNVVVQMGLTSRKTILAQLGNLGKKGFEVLPYYEKLAEALEKCSNEEGIILKKRDSMYYANERTDDWLKFKKHVEKLCRFYKYEINKDFSITLTDDFHRVKCNDLAAKTKIDTYRYVDCEVTGLEFTEKGHIRMPVIKRVL